MLAPNRKNLYEQDIIFQKLKICKGKKKLVLPINFFKDMFDTYKPHKNLFIMKTIKQLFIVAIFALGLFVSCTPESIENGQTPQQVDRNLPPLQNG